jgi:hypothetical protein
MANPGRSVASKPATITRPVTEESVTDDHNPQVISSDSVSKESDGTGSKEVRGPSEGLSEALSGAVKDDYLDDDQWVTDDEDDEDQEDFWDDDDNVSEGRKEDESEEEKQRRKFANKIQKLRKILKVKERQLKEKNYNARCTVANDSKAKPMLPVSSEAFVNLFEKYEEDVANAGKKTHTQEGKKADAYPKLFLPKMSNYVVEDVPWKTEALSTDDALKGSSVFKGQNFPPFTVPFKQFTNLDSSNRKSLNVLSYTDCFLWGVTKHLRVMKRKLGSRRYEEDPTLSLEQVEDLYWQTVESLGFLESAAKGLNDLIKMTISRIGLNTLLRRDNWIAHFTTTPSASGKNALRRAPFNGDGLFSSEVLEKVLDTVKADKHDDVQDAILHGFGENSQASSRRNGRGRVFSFRGRGGRGSNRGRGNALWPTYRNGQTMHQFTRGGRGGGRGFQRGGRGNRARGSNRGAKQPGQA